KQRMRRCMRRPQVRYHERMHIGVPRELKREEHRVGLTPAGARELATAGHSVLIETGAGADAGFADADYEAAGARIAASSDELYGQSELIVKVKEPQPEELDRMGPDHVLFGYLHLAAEPALARELMKRRITAIAYETVTGPGGTLP